MIGSTPESFAETINQQNERIALLENKLIEILKYSTPHVSYMGAAVIVGMIMECDFKDTEKYRTEK